MSTAVPPARGTCQRCGMSTPVVAGLIVDHRPAGSDIASGQCRGSRKHPRCDGYVPAWSQSDVRARAGGLRDYIREDGIPDNYPPKLRRACQSGEWTRAVFLEHSHMARYTAWALADLAANRPCNDCGGSGYVAKLKPTKVGPGYQTFANAYESEWRPYIVSDHDERDYHVKDCRSCGPGRCPS